MSIIHPDIGIANSRRGFLKHGLGLGIGGLVCGCGRTIIGGSAGQGPGPGPNTPTDPTKPDGDPTSGVVPTTSTTDTQPPVSSYLQVTANVTSNAAGTVGPDFMGLSFGKEAMKYFSASETNLVNRFKALGSGVLRITASDTFTWDPSAARGTALITSQADIDSLAAFMSAVGWRVIYGISLAENTESLAADEAVYATQRLGGSLYCFALGNEPDSFNTVYNYTPGDKTWDYARFKAKWDRLSAAILAPDKAPTALFSGPDAANNVDRYSSRFANDLRASRKLMLLSQHHYRIRSTIEKSISSLLVTPDPVLTMGIPVIDPVAKLPALKAAADLSGIPFRITETNSATGGGVAGVSDVYASALWCIDLMFTVAKGGGQGVNFHAGRSVAYTPLAFTYDHLDVATGIRPEYYGLLFFSMAGLGQVLEASVDAGGFNLSAYAIKTGAGFSVMFVNKEASQSFKVALQLPASVTKATVLQLTGPGLLSKTGIKIQNAEISATFGLGAMDAAYSAPFSGPNVTVNVPALTAVLVKAT